MVFGKLFKSENKKKEETGSQGGGVFSKLKSGLKKTREKLGSGIRSILSPGRRIDDTVLRELEEKMITADVGVQPSLALIDQLKKSYKDREIEDSAEIMDFLKQSMISMLPEKERLDNSGSPTVIMVVGVNGTGKTTSIAKLAWSLKQQGKNVVLGAADTYRAAAVEQLEIWAGRAGVEIVKQTEGADPSAVAFDAAESALSKNADYLILDTAGRLHTQINLMKQLEKIKRTLAKKIPGAPHEILLVLDATTGQNAIQQGKKFSDNLDGITGIVLAKLDGTAKGGVVLSIGHELSIPVIYVGVGEKMEDLEPFDRNAFVQAIFA